MLHSSTPRQPRARGSTKTTPLLGHDRNSVPSLSMKALTGVAAPQKSKTTRSSTPRSRKGCRTCRQRHVKCDETRPSCLKCTHSGWTCDRYGPQNATPLTSIRASPPALMLSIASYSIPFRIPGSQQDRQALHYFCVQGSHDIAGYLGSSFWSRTVLRASHEEPAVRQALVSLSSLHLEYATSDDIKAVREDILNQHGKALRALRKRVEAGNSDAVRTALVCCVLFYCFESTLGNNESAMHHLQCGIEMISHLYQACHRLQEDEDMAAVSAVFERLDLQATIFDNSRTPVLNLKPSKDLQVSRACQLEYSSFERLQDAHDALVKLQNWLFHFLNENLAYKNDESNHILADILDEKKILLEHLETWQKSFESLKHQSASGPSEVCGVKVLLIHWQVSRMLLASDYPHDETIFGGSPNTEAKHVLELASDVLQTTQERNASAEAAKSPRRNFSSETGVVAPLFILAMKCYDKKICREATDLLTVAKRREGLYDSQTMAAITRQFREARSQKTLDSMGQEAYRELSLEKTFEKELDKATGGMDRIADFVRLGLSVSLS